jgi:putative hemolysin
MMVFEITIVLLLLMLNGFFAMSELAVVSARRGRLQRLASEGDRGAQVALELASEPDKFLSSVQIGITLIGILTGAFSGATLAEKLGQWLRGFPLIAPYGSTIALVVVVMAITYLTLIFGELVPKQIALGNADGVAARVARPMRLVARVGGPLVAALGWSSRVVLRLLGVQPRGDQTVTEEEIISLVAEGAESGVFAKMERRMIEGVLRLADRPVRSIMTPRRNVVWIDPDDDPKEIVHRVLACDFSRFLVCRGSVDEVIGVVRKKDLLNLCLTGNPLDLRSVVRQPLVVPETVSVLKTLDPKSGSWMIARWCRIGANHRDGDRNDESGGSPGG